MLVHQSKQHNAICKFLVSWFPTIQRFWNLLFHEYEFHCFYFIYIYIYISYKFFVCFDYMLHINSILSLNVMIINNEGYNMQ
jgi:hypothetical protein